MMAKCFLEKTPYIIAEVGSNWNTFEDCKQAIWHAKLAGADAVKFQCFTHKALYGFDGEMGSELPVEWIPLLKNKADFEGIDFMCTAFDVKTLQAITPHVKYHKLSSCEAEHVDLQNAIMASGKPAFVSLGAHTKDAMKMIIERFHNHPTIFMYCVVEYPAREVYPEKIFQMRNYFEVPIGYSCHSKDVATIPVLACREYGAVALEKHFNPLGRIGPDSGHSLSTEQFARMVSLIRGDGIINIGPEKNEDDARFRHTRRLIMMRDKKKGDTIEYDEDYGIYRFVIGGLYKASTAPYLLMDFHKQKLSRDMKMGEPLSYSDIEIE